MAERPEIHAETIAQVILLAREMAEATSVGARDGVRDASSFGRAEREFRDFVAGLTEDEQLVLVAVLWIGRDSFGAEEFDEAIRTARQEATNPTEDYLGGQPMLAEHLEAGLEALGISPSEAEGGLY